eukprot:TRINITY_DN1953_c0_g1_i17.p2 TRINITY_DN1953_c0_g1~~TRINITY_DN1953_c0_g1_i17.p2  ORF type:complete len:101 (+),score=3.89 TRINITY_DN1953_c0_g1_i17:91-393(+)
MNSRRLCNHNLGVVVLQPFNLEADEHLDGSAVNGTSAGLHADDLSALLAETEMSARKHCGIRQLRVAHHALLALFLIPLFFALRPIKLLQIVKRILNLFY